MLSRLFRNKKIPSNPFATSNGKKAVSQDRKEIPTILSTNPIEEHQYPGVELEDYYLYYLQDSLKDSMATRAKVIYITKRELLCELNSTTPITYNKNALSDNKTRYAVESLPQDGLFEVGNDLQIKLQIPFRNEYIRATAKIIGVDNSMPDSIRLKLRYTKILGGDNEVLFETILDMLL